MEIPTGNLGAGGSTFDFCDSVDMEIPAGNLGADDSTLDFCDSVDMEIPAGNFGADGSSLDFCDSSTDPLVFAIGSSSSSSSSFSESELSLDAGVILIVDLDIRAWKNPDGGSKAGGSLSLCFSILTLLKSKPSLSSLRKSLTRGR